MVTVDILLYILAGNYSLTAENLRNQWTKTEENEQESDNFFHCVCIIPYVQNVFDSHHT